MQFAPEEWIYRAGEVANDMYFVASGAIDELGEKDKVNSFTVTTIHGPVSNAGADKIFESANGY